MATRAFDSPLGRLVLDAEGEMLTGVRWAAQSEKPRTEGKSAMLSEVARQLDRYFAGRLKRFDLKIRSKRFSRPAK